MWPGQACWGSGGGGGRRPRQGKQTTLPRKPPPKVLSTCWVLEASCKPPAAALQGARPFLGPKLSFAPLGSGEPRLSPQSRFQM